MKKISYLVALVCLAFLAWTMSCQSPSSTGNPASSKIANDNQSNSNNNDNSSNSDTDTDTDTAMGFLRLTLKDAPADDAKNIWVKISNIRVHRACDDEEDCFTTVWENPTGQDIDLLALKTTPLTFTATLPAGTYNQIRMAIISGEIVFGPPGAPDPSDVRYPLTVPSDEIKTHLHFEVAEDGMTHITLDLDAKNSIHVIKKGKKDVYQLRPVVNVVEVEEGSGN
jgi:hypothetical protein